MLTQQAVQISYSERRVCSSQFMNTLASFKLTYHVGKYFEISLPRITPLGIQEINVQYLTLPQTILKNLHILLNIFILQISNIVIV